MTTISITPKTLQFEAQNEDRMSFFLSLIDGKSFKVKCTTNGYEYELVVSKIMHEDGSKKKFLFQAVCKHAKSPDGLSNNVVCYYTGYFDSFTKKGWIKSINALTW
jgi:hypothetical protein